MIKLAELEPQFIRYETRVEDHEVVDGDPATWRERGAPTKTVTGPREYNIPVDTLAEAQGIMFLCPKCYQENGGAVGTHRCQVSFAGRGVQASQGVQGNPPPRWNVSGTSYDDLSTTPSIQLIGGCNWHGYITQGEVSCI